jgi:hypothetical protein
VAPQPRSFVADRRIAARAVGDLMLAAGGD